MPRRQGGGTRPIPTAVLKMTNSTVPDRKGRRNEPDAIPGGLSTPPADFNKRECWWWKESVNNLQKMGVAGAGEFAVISRYCRLQAELEILDADIVKNGHSYLRGNGAQYRRVESKVRQEVIAQVIKLQVELGLTPSARASVQKIDEPVSPLDEFIA